MRRQRLSAPIMSRLTWHENVATFLCIKRPFEQPSDVNNNNVREKSSRGITYCLHTRTTLNWEILTIKSNSEQEIRSGATRSITVWMLPNLMNRANSKRHASRKLYVNTLFGDTIWWVGAIQIHHTHIRDHSRIYVLNHGQRLGPSLLYYSYIRACLILDLNIVYSVIYRENDRLSFL